MDAEDWVVRVLVVEPSRDALVTLGILLRSEGYIVDLATTGTEALAKAMTRRPDAVLLNLHMPTPSAFDVARELHVRHGEECPVLIAITPHRDLAQQAKCSGFDHVVGRPYESDGLLRLFGGLKRRSKPCR